MVTNKVIRLLKRDKNLLVDVNVGELAAHHEHQLAFWGFSLDEDENCFIAQPNDLVETAKKVSNYFQKCNLEIEIEASLVGQLEDSRQRENVLLEAKARGSNLKDGTLDHKNAAEFLSYLESDVSRTLKDHQLKSALHLLAVNNGANFSVPGSGKTTVVLSVFGMLRKKNVVDALFVVGPPACFGPWRDEYEEVFGKSPTYVTLAGGDIEERHSNYFANTSSVCDLYLTSFQTLMRDWDKVRQFFSRQGIRFYLVVDEAHYMKRIDGSWASAVLQIAKFAKHRCILTGTPFPHSYSDAFNLFDFLWPDSPPISRHDKNRISIFLENEELEQASNVLNNSVGPLFYRVRKSDLGLASQIFHEPILIQMNERERRVYDFILDKIKVESQQDYFRDLNLVLRLRRGRMIRLRQCLSYVKLLTTALDDYEEVLFEDKDSLANLIQNYDNFERPAKILGLIELVNKLRMQGEKIVIWSNFVKTLELIKHTVISLGFPARLIYGATPVERIENNKDDLTRERIIKEFVSKESGIDILIANPAACAESISLHKTCSYSIYYDLSYNCAQYLQSLDRIHRVGGSEQKQSNYYFLQYEQSLDQDILENVRSKAERMSQIVDQDYAIYSLDMFDADDEIEAYERIFTNES